MNLFKKCLVVTFLLVMTQLASADLFVVSIDEWTNCKTYPDNVTICQKNPTYNLIEKNIMPNINTHYYDDVLEEVVKSKNEKIGNLENRVTGYAAYNTEIEDWYSAMEKVYIAGIAMLSILLIHAHYRISKLRKQK
ncbi:MAG: hypothetical protein Q8N77_01970 [Nanoarchaeota archaeon]|nr:hypothetical protein [Nanoarchaeota archaeon]